MFAGIERHIPNAFAALAHDVAVRELLARNVASVVADFRKAWTGALIVGGGIVCLVLVAFAVGFGLWERHEINRLTKQKDALEADVLSLRSTEQDFERRGRRIIWNRCGNYLCFVVKNKDRDWVEPNGERLAIPVTIQDH